MVCKEELCCWFRNLSPRNRIEYMCTLLHMCLPLELRFVGTVLEHYGKKDYHYLRNDEVAANKQSEIQKYRNISKPEILRAKVFVTLALMRSSSTACAQIIYEIIESKLTTVFSFGPGADSRLADEILTVLTLAANHPAFMFDQKLHLHEHLNRLKQMQREKVEEEEVSLDLYPDNHLPHYSAEDPSLSAHPALCNRHSPVQQPRKVFVQYIEVRGSKKAAEKKPGPEYQIVATWSNGEATEVSKRFREIQDFHRQMIDQFPDEKPPNGKLPSLPAGSPHRHSTPEEHITEQIRMLNNYFRSLTSVPSHILESEHVCQFFKGMVIRQAPPPMVAPSLPYHQPDDPAGRIHRIYPAGHSVCIVPRFPTSSACPTLVMQHMPVHHHQQHAPPQPSTQQQPSPVSPSRSELSSTTTSPTGSRSTSPDLSTPSVTQLLKLLGLDKYASALGSLSFEQLSSLSCEELSKQGLPRDAQHILRSKLDQINTEKPVLMNGVVDNMGYPPFNPPAQWLPVSSYGHYRVPLAPASPRSGISLMDSSSGAVSDVASGGGASPPVSPGPAKMQGAHLGKGATAEDSSEGSEDLDREKGEILPDTAKNHNHQPGKTAQVKVSPGSGGGGGSSSPRPSSASARMTPPDDTTVKPPLLPMQAMPQAMIPFYYQPSPTAPPGLVGQYVDPKGEVGIMGVVPNSNNNTNNNYTTEAIPIMSTGLPQRPSLIQTGAGVVRPPFKTGQPQPAHTNMGGMLHSKNLIAMPAEHKPGSPVIPHVIMRHGDMQNPMVQGGASSQMESGAPQRMPLYHHVPYGMGQGGAMVTGHMPPVHPAQPGMFSIPLATRSVQTSLPGSASVMTVSASHPVTVVTASHSSATTATAVHRSPSHGSGNGNSQRDSGNESISGGASGLVTDGSLRSSPLQGGGVTVTQVATASSPPASQGCHMCAQGTQFSHNQYGHVPYPYPPFFVPPGPNGIMPVPAMSGYYATNQSLPSGVLTNGYTSDMYPYSHPGYPTLNPSTAHIYPMMPGTTLYQGTPSQPGMGTGHGGTRGSMAPPQPLPTGGLAAAGQQASSVAVKQRNTGCCNCGSLTHKAADCNESSMETMSGKSVYSLKYKPGDDSD
ncbi:uncharacterized protein LOC143285496 isoform X2 [Babylonia areolata]|uniref:uncharacterized protein LOC143285496 isoform X2 n=1 Tax=Babylonia areolata TaxID=304850 RepID=UPI003FD1E429